MTVYVSTDKIFFGGDHLTGTYIPGVYTVEVRAWTINNVDTGEFQDLLVTIEDPCLLASLTFDQSSALRSPPEISLT